MTQSSAVVTTEEGGRQNMFAKEPQIEVMDKEYGPEAELLNGRLAMIGWVAAIGAYITSGQIIPGIFQMSDLQLAFLFPYIPFLSLVIVFAFLGLIDNNNDDDEDGDGGVMQIAFNRS